MGQENLGQDLEALREDVTKLRSDLSQLAKSLLDKGKSETDTAKDRVMEELMSNLRSARDKSSETVESVEHKIQEKPLMSLLIAFVVGLILGKLFESR
ncbi:MAG: DUF883 family protein [Thermodesulfobacteriota bacterium]|jgi:ElaB/YqjD/DUF883 family membrane-anchored ribosome-binding protein